MVNFLLSNDLSQFAGDLNKCIKEYGSLCMCRPDDKKGKAIECDRVYASTVNVLLANKHIVFNKIRDRILEFRRNGQLILTIIK